MRLSRTGRLLAGIAGEPATLDAAPIGRGADNAWEHLDDSHIIGQCCEAGACKTFIRGADGAFTEAFGPSNLIRAGGGRYAILGEGVSIDSARAGFDRWPLAMSDAGEPADTNHQDIVITDAAGQEIDRLDGGSWSAGDDRRAFYRDGIFSHQSTTRGWMLRDPRARADVPYVPWSEVSWLVPMTIHGEVWVVERRNLTLTIRKAESQQAYLVGRWTPAVQLFNPDARVIGDNLVVVWSGNPQESVASIQRLEIPIGSINGLPIVPWAELPADPPAGDPVDTPDTPQVDHECQGRVRALEAELAATTAKAQALESEKARLITQHAVEVKRLNDERDTYKKQADTVTAAVRRFPPYLQRLTARFFQANADA